MIEMAMVIGFPHIYMVTEQLRRIILERLPLRTLFPQAISTFTTRPITVSESYLRKVRLSVPMIETAIEYAETADIFLIIGTSLNVYPAAGLLNYVPANTPVYLIDPKQVPIASGRKVHVIQKGASEGMEELKKILVR